MESSVDIELLMETATVLNRTGRDLVSCCSSNCRSIISELDGIASKYRDYSKVTNKVREIKTYINNILKLSKQLEETNQNLVTGLKNTAKVYKEGEKQAKEIVTKDKTTIGGKIVSKIGDKTLDLPRHKSIKEVDIKSEEDAKKYVTELEQKAKDIEMYATMLNNYRASGQGEPEWLIKKLEELGVTYGIIKNADELVVNKKESESLYGYDDDIAEVRDLGACILVKYTNGLIQIFNKNDIPRGCLKAFEDRNLWSAGGVPLKTIMGFVGETQEDVSLEQDKKECVVNGKGVPYPVIEVEGYGQVPFPIGPYEPNNSILRAQFTDSYKKQFKEWWIAQGRLWPEGEVNIHHIKPLSKGGDNSFTNLVPLVQPDGHQPFTSWWRSYPPKKQGG